jgi:biopolymer transport protein ExbD
MARALPSMDDVSLNMTPMIDIVFQLILFFLFSLKFKSLDYRFESQLPLYRGLKPTSTPAEEHPRLQVSLFRLDEIEPDKARTKMKFAGSEWTLADSASYEEREKTFASLRVKLEQVRQATSIVDGEIKTPPPSGAFVRHADVMKVLDTFIEAKVFDVQFEGAPAPVPGRH